MFKFILPIITRRLAYPYLLGALLLFVLAGSYLGIRKWMDNRTEQKQDTEIIRKGEEYLGSWGQKSDKGLILFRLHRDGTFSYKQVAGPTRDTTSIKGRYEIARAAGGRTGNDYPRLIAIGPKDDTIINHYIAYITPYDAAALDQGYDKMVLNAGGRLDTAGLVFFRIKTFH
ncbi:hypothetical protein [Niabella sp.]|uniref:hypothetical protein n=1 Tax=Niabella sp. TaxID=1962976 RepID=UPI00262F4880|nr:hypothetical protein [Niabella sp.]